MNDLISRQAAIDALAKFVPYAICDESTESYTNGLTDAYNLICQLPSAEPEVIRCKDCKHRPFDGEDSQGFGVEFPDEKCPCQCSDGWYNWRPNNEWFCANAERRAVVR